MAGICPSPVLNGGNCRQIKKSGYDLSKTGLGDMAVSTRLFLLKTNGQGERKLGKRCSLGFLSHSSSLKHSGTWLPGVMMQCEKLRFFCETCFQQGKGQETNEVDSHRKDISLWFWVVFLPPERTVQDQISQNQDSCKCFCTPCWWSSAISLFGYLS